MHKLLFFAILVAMVALVACSDPTPTPAPTATPAPTNTPVPTATPIPEPTATTVPTPVPPTAVPEAEPTAEPESQMVEGMGPLMPLRLDDPLAIAQELSEDELACLAGSADIDRLLQVFAAPELAGPEEQAQLIGCLSDETVLRLFATGLLADAGPLSVETSMCIRSGMNGVDLKSVMLAGNSGDEAAAMVGSMSALFVTLSCLNDEEFAAAAPALGMQPEERESLDCVLEQLGGAESMGQTLGAGDEAAMMALFGAAMGCGMQLEGAGPGG